MNTTLMTPRKLDTVTDYDRIAEAIEFIAQHWQRRPALREIADRQGLSEFHFQRVFSRWVGISPKRFMQYLTIDHARERLRASRSVLDLALDAGLSGPGRLHDLFVTIDAMTPGEYRQMGRGLRIEHGVHESPFGRCLLGLTARGVCWLSFTGRDESEDDALAPLRETWPSAALVRRPAATRAIAERIFRRSPGERGDALPLLVHGTNFQIKVWEALLRIPPGRVASYGDLAALCDARAARAVGAAVGANPISYLIPCHRVLHALGRVTRYRWGATRKLAMLGWEAAQAETAGVLSS